MNDDMNLSLDLVSTFSSQIVKLVMTVLCIPMVWTINEGSMVMCTEIELGLVSRPALTDAIWL